MKSQLVPFLLGSLFTVDLCAQSTLQFSVVQDPVLEVKTGYDTTVLKGSRIILEAAATAKGGLGIYKTSKLL